MNRASQTLLEQLKITESSIQHRLELFSLSKSEFILLKQYEEFIESNSPAIVQEFYAQQTAIEEISILIGDAGTLEKLHEAQLSYIRTLFSGDYGIDYINSRLRIGMVHKRIGVSPHLYLSAVQLLKEIIYKYLKIHCSDQAEYTQITHILDNLLNFDIAYVFDTYIRSMLTEIEVGREKAEEYANKMELMVKERTQQLHELTIRDYLTNIYNSRHMHAALSREYKIAQRQQTPLAIAYFDINKFKEINDTFGHSTGDQVLQHFAKAINSACRDTDYPCRIGGDEFIIIMPNTDDEAAQNLLTRIGSPSHSSMPNYTFSTGIAQTGPEIYETPEQLLKRADKAMYDQKTLYKKADK